MVLAESCVKLFNDNCLQMLTLRSKLSGAVYCNRSCLWVCMWVCLWVGLLPRQPLAWRNTHWTRLDKYQGPPGSRGPQAWH